MGGPVWIPPPLPHFDKEKAKAKRDLPDSDKDDMKDHEDLDYFKAVGKNRKDNDELGRLPYQLKREYLSILEELTTKQTDVCNAMIFVMENTNFCKPIIKVLSQEISE